MNSLEIKFSPDAQKTNPWAEDPCVYHTLNAFGPTEVQVPGQMRATAVEFIQGMNSTMYRAELELEDGLHSVVLKMLHRDMSEEDLAQEAAVYQTLHTLQGTAIPKFYGLYSGTCPHKITTFCLMFEYCGVGVDEVSGFHMLPEKGRQEILLHVANIHRLGHHLPDFTERNVAVRDETYRLVDFHILDPHKCLFKGSWRFGEQVPDEQEFGCNILRYVGRRLCVWQEVSLPVPILTIGEHELYEWHVPSEEIRSRLTKPYMLEYYNRPRYIKWLAQVRLSINTWEGGPDDIEGIVQHANSMEIRETLYETEEEFIISD